MKKIYLAGPTVFLPNPFMFFNRMKEICSQYNLQGIAPLDNQLELEAEKPGKDLITRIVKADFDLMDQVDGAIFCLNPFRRSTEMDAGTAVEIGYIKAQKKPMAGWTTDGRFYPEKVEQFFKETYNLPLVQTQPNEEGGTSGSFRDPDGILVHSEGMIQNGMTQGAIELSGGRVYVNSQWDIAFEEAAKCLSKQFS